MAGVTAAGWYQGTLRPDGRRRDRGGGLDGARSYYVRIFREADQDKNGYVDRKELEQPVNEAYYLRGLFALADRDGDGKLYEKELNAYLDLQDKGGVAFTTLR